MKKIAVLEIGSNGLRYESVIAGEGSKDVIDRKNLRLDILRLVKEIEEGAKVDILDDLSLKVNQIVKLGLSQSPESFKCFGTEACRRLERAVPGYWREKGLPVEVLSPKQEAKFAFESARASISEIERTKKVAVIDVGNGSSDFFIRTGAKEDYFSSLKIGASQLMTSFSEKDGNLSSEFNDVSIWAEELPKNCTDLSDFTVVLMGGLITKICWLQFRNDRFHRYRSPDINGFKSTILSLDAVDQQIFEILKTAGQMAARSWIDPKETEEWKMLHILAGIKYFENVGRQLTFDNFVVCSQSVRHGVLAEMTCT